MVALGSSTQRRRRVRIIQIQSELGKKKGKKSSTLRDGRTEIEAREEKRREMEEASQSTSKTDRQLANWSTAKSRLDRKGTSTRDAKSWNPSGGSSRYRKRTVIHGIVTRLQGTSATSSYPAMQDILLKL